MKNAIQLLTYFYPGSPAVRCILMAVILTIVGGFPAFAQTSYTLEFNLNAANGLASTNTPLNPVAVTTVAEVSGVNPALSVQSNTAPYTLDQTYTLTGPYSTMMNTSAIAQTSADYIGNTSTAAATITNTGTTTLTINVNGVVPPVVDLFEYSGGANVAAKYGVDSSSADQYIDYGSADGNYTWTYVLSPGHSLTVSGGGTINTELDPDGIPVGGPSFFSSPMNLSITPGGLSNYNTGLPTSYNLIYNFTTIDGTANGSEFLTANDTAGLADFSLSANYCLRSYMANLTGPTSATWQMAGSRGSGIDLIEELDEVDTYVTNTGTRNLTVDVNGTLAGTDYGSSTLNVFSTAGQNFSFLADNPSSGPQPPPPPPTTASIVLPPGAVAVINDKGEATDPDNINYKSIYSSNVNFSVTPGPDSLLTVASTASQGFPAAISNYNPGAASYVAPISTLSGPATGLANPEAVNFDGSGDLFVADASGGVSEFTVGAEDGNASAASTTAWPNGYSGATSAGVTFSGNTYAVLQSPSTAVDESGTIVPASSLAGTPLAVATNGVNLFLALHNTGTGNFIVAQPLSSSNSGFTIAGSATNLGGANDGTNVVLSYSPLSTRLYALISAPIGYNGPTGEPRVCVFPSTTPLQAVGANEAPLRVLQGPKTGLDNKQILSLAEDPENGNLYVLTLDSNYNGLIYVYDRLASGNVTPINSFSDGITHFRNATSLSFSSAPYLSVIDSQLAATATVGYPFSYQIDATNVPLSFAAANLPSGLSLNPTTGVISGTPTAAGIFNVPISATNGSNTVSATLVLTVISDPDLNIGLGQPATASSNEAGNLPSNANDGNITTRWAASDATYPQWWTVDLGAIKTLSRVDINWYNNATRYYQYSIQTSTDGLTFTTAVDKTGNNVFGPTSDYANVSARYVRVEVTGASGGWASAYEISVYGH